MKTPHIEHDLTIWMDDDLPTRLVYAGKRWRVTDTPTRLRDSVWKIPTGSARGFYGWRFQATDEAGESFVFDIYPSSDGWHVHGVYA